MGIAALITALVLHASALQHRQQVSMQPVWPADGTITSPFGDDNGRYHPGIDIGILKSLVVRAAVPGVVEEVGEPTGFEGYGNIVLVRSRGYEELYAHLSAWAVKPGQRLEAGETIATAGCTGYCTGTHLHFEVRRDGKAVSPLTTVLRPLVTPAPTEPVTPELKPVSPPSGPLERTLASALRKPMS